MLDLSRVRQKWSLACAVLLICSRSQATEQTQSRVDARIRDLIVALHPEYETSDYRLSIGGRRMVGLNFPVTDWFFSLEPLPISGLGYVYNPTSAPCPKLANSFPEGTCVLAADGQGQPVLIGRIALGKQGTIAAEISNPNVAERDAQFSASIRTGATKEEIDRRLVNAGARFPPSQQASFTALLKKSNLPRFLRAKTRGEPRFCLTTRSSSTASTYPANYWIQILRAKRTTYVAVFEPFEGSMTVLLPIHEQSQIHNACIE